MFRISNFALWVILLTLTWPSSRMQAQDNFLPKREFRGVWVATVANIDYPRRPTDWAVAQREMYKQLLGRLQETGFNAVIFQVRAAGDALYYSELVPWSKYLTGLQGKPPSSDYDPLTFYIEETHRRGMEFHAWLNPFRATTNLDTLSLASNHAFNQHRDWMVRYGDKFYFNPALPEVREHLLQVVTEVIQYYDVDAIHFDDYFYPYRNGTEEFPDSLDFFRYGGAFSSIDDWRRSNIDAFIEAVAAQIKALKPHVKFGISPFGVWRNKNRDPQGSETTAGATTYDDLYADVRKWLRLGWVDYVIPQLYWNIGFPPADFDELLKWWSTNSYDRHLYIGHAAYKVENNVEIAWFYPEEIPNQLKHNRRNFLTKGSTFFNSRAVLENRLGLRDSLAWYFREPALIPEMPALSQPTKAAPDLRSVGTKYRKPRLKWRPDKADRDKPPYYYVVYRFEGDEKQDLEDPGNIIHISGFNTGEKTFTFVDEKAEPGKRYTYVVTAVNRQHSESKSSRSRRVLVTETGIRRLR